MKRFLSVRVVMLISIMLLGSYSAAAIERPVAIERPFALNGMGRAEFILDETGKPVGATLTAAGTATHLGLWTATGIVRFVEDPEKPGVIRSYGAATIFAANGDRLEVETFGTLDPSGMDQGEMRIVGGTGRFASASGTPSIVVSINAPNGAFELTAVGKIRF